MEQITDIQIQALIDQMLDDNRNFPSPYTLVAALRELRDTRQALATSEAREKGLREALMLFAEEAEASIACMGASSNLVRSVHIDVYQAVSDVARKALTQEDAK